MLRGRSEPSGRTDLSPSALPEAVRSSPNAYPSGEQPFSCDERPPGVLFYQNRESFFFPYALLQGLRFNQGQLTVSFVTADVVIDGEGLHEIYLQLAAQKVSRIVEQGERYRAVSEGTAFVRKIEHVSK